MLSEYSMDRRYSVRTRSGLRPHPLRRLALPRHGVEHRAVADVVPVDEPGQRRPGRVAGEQRDLRHHRGRGPGAASSVRSNADRVYWSGHAGEVEPRAAVAEARGRRRPCRSRRTTPPASACVMPGITPTVRQPARRKAPLRVSRSLAIRLRYRCWLSIHRPDSNVECANQLSPPDRRRGEEPARGSRTRPQSACGSRRRAPRRPAVRTADSRSRRARSSRRRRSRRPCRVARSAARSPGVSRNASTAASAANACWSAMPACTLSTLS